MKLIQRVLLVLLALSVSCSTVVIDESAHAAESNDTSVIIEGCGNQPISGFTYCRRSVGQINDTDVVYVHIPESNCERESCVEILVFSPTGGQGSPTFVRKGARLHPIHWADLTGRQEFTQGDSGFWTIAMVVYWIDNEGLERRTAMIGEIRLRVLSADYVSLSQSRGEGPYAFRWRVQGGFNLGYTTSGRSAVWR